MLLLTLGTEFKKQFILSLNFTLSSDEICFQSNDDYIALKFEEICLCLEFPSNDKNYILIATFESLNSDFDHEFSIFMFKIEKKDIHKFSEITELNDLGKEQLKISRRTKIELEAVSKFDILEKNSQNEWEKVSKLSDSIFYVFAGTTKVISFSLSFQRTSFIKPQVISDVTFLKLTHQDGEFCNMLKIYPTFKDYKEEEMCFEFYANWHLHSMEPYKYNGSNMSSYIYYFKAIVSIICENLNSEIIFEIPFGINLIPQMPKVQTNAPISSVFNINLSLDKMIGDKYLFSLSNYMNNHKIPSKDYYNQIFDTLQQKQEKNNPVSQLSLAGDTSNLDSCTDIFQVNKEWLEFVANRLKGASDDRYIQNNCFKGIPNKLRSEVWHSLFNPKLNEKAVDAFERYSGQNSKFEELIRKDSKRTFPNSEKFISSSIFEKNLIQLCSFFSLFDKNIGYYQGFSFIAGALLYLLDMNNAVCCIVHLMHSLQFSELLNFDFFQISLEMDIFTRLIEEYLPDLFSHFERISMHTVYYAFQWFLTVFAGKFPLAFVFRVLDLFFLQPKELLIITLHSICLQLLRKVANRLVFVDLEKCLSILNIELPSLFLVQSEIDEFFQALSENIIPFQKYEKVSKDVYNSLNTGTGQNLPKIPTEKAAFTDFDSNALLINEKDFNRKGSTIAEIFMKIKAEKNEQQKKIELLEEKNKILREIIENSLERVFDVQLKIEGKNQELTHKVEDLSDIFVEENKKLKDIILKCKCSSSESDQNSGLPSVNSVLDSHPPKPSTKHNSLEERFSEIKKYKKTQLNDVMFARMEAEIVHQEYLNVKK
ncbi:MAG: Rab GTPase-activating protein 1 [Paramarteilia canceri]